MRIAYVAAETFPNAKTRSPAVTVHEQDELSKFKLDTGTGFVFEDHSGQELLKCVSRAISNYHNEKNGMLKDYSWKHSSEQYIELYKLVIDKRR